MQEENQPTFVKTLKSKFSGYRLWEKNDIKVVNEKDIEEDIESHKP